MRGNYNIDEEPLPAGWRLALTDCFWSGKPVISSLHRVQHVIIWKTCDQQTKLHLIRQSCIKYMEVEKAFGTSLTSNKTDVIFSQNCIQHVSLFKGFDQFISSLERLTFILSLDESLQGILLWLETSYSFGSIDYTLLIVLLWLNVIHTKRMFSWINQSFAKKKQVFSISRFWPQKMHRRKMYFTSLIFTIGLIHLTYWFNLCWNLLPFFCMFN